jgi:hypothetical protein
MDLYQAHTGISRWCANGWRCAKILDKGVCRNTESIGLEVICRQRLAGFVRASGDAGKHCMTQTTCTMSDAYMQGDIAGYLWLVRMCCSRSITISE